MVNPSRVTSGPDAPEQQPGASPPRRWHVLELLPSELLHYEDAPELLGHERDYLYCDGKIE
ncbi:hypothetical protein [Deinococcus sp.]|uniref:hypothetical protein n=1 Tax=Deinococcus sp. TaxID=47478 RepID=UPI003CC63D1E